MKSVSIKSALEAILIKESFQNILCSLYDSELRTDDIASLIEIDITEAADCLAVLQKAGLVNYKARDGNNYYYLTNPKICNAILMLRDELYKTMQAQHSNQ